MNWPHGGHSRSGNYAPVSCNLMERTWPGTRSMNPRFSTSPQTMCRLGLSPNPANARLPGVFCRTYGSFPALVLVADSATKARAAGLTQNPTSVIAMAMWVTTNETVST